MAKPASAKKGLSQFLEAQRGPVSDQAQAPGVAERPAARAAAGPPAAGAGKDAGSTPRVAPRRRERRRTKEGKEQLLVYLFPAGVKELKLIGVEEDRSTSELVAEAVNEWLQRRGRPPVA
jgi:hypothetical protein